MAEAAEKGGVSPLVLFTGVAGHRQEAAHRELRLRLCGITTGGRRQVMPSVPGQEHLHIHTYIHTGFSGLAEKSCSLNSTLSANKALECLSSSPVPLLPAASQTPPEDYVPMRGHTEASFPTTLFALCLLNATPPTIQQYLYCQ